MITDWFEDETFVAKLIQYGMEGMMAETSNARGVVAYSLDETYIKDAEEIAKLVKKHNETE